MEDLFRRIAHSPRITAILYFIAIPLFGVIYALMPNDFYQANATAEVRARDLRREIQRQMLDVVEPVYRRAEPVTGLKVTALRPDEGAVSFETPFKHRSSRSNLTYRPVWSLELPPLEESTAGSFRLYVRIERVPLFLSLALKRHNEGDADAYRWGPLGPARLSPDPDSTDVARARGFTTIEGILTVPDTLYSNVERYYTAAQGSPDKLTGKLMRFTYLSAMTITTLGFGDIVPVSDRARFAVACEAIYGVVLVGLFLNAVATRRQLEQQNRRD